MALVTANGVALPTPTDFQVTISDLTKNDRNAAGTMIIERIATKQKLSLSYAYLSASDLSTILNAISPVFYNVTYLDPMTNAYVTSSFCTSDRNMGMIDFVGGIPRYRDLKFDLTER